VGIAKVIVQVEFDLWTILGIRGCIPSGLLQDESSQFSKVVSKRAAIINNNIDELSIGVGSEP
jgi:hypothetical protein